MRILVVLPRVPFPLEKGDKLRAFHQVRMLSRHHEIHLFCLNDKELHPDALDKLKPYCRSITIHDLTWPGILWNMVCAGFTNTPFQVGYFHSRTAHRKFDRLVGQIRPDRIYCQLVRTASYVRNCSVPGTLDYQDVFSKGVERRIARTPFLFRWAYHMEYRRMLRYEALVFDWFIQRTIISRPDRDLIPHPDREKIAVVPNGVNHDYFTPQSIDPVYDLLFTGNMAYPPNVDSALFLAGEILPLIHRERPETTLLIAGANPHPRIRALESDKITVAGWVRDMRDCYAQARVFVAPMRIGTGLQNKLLEAMSMEMPCVTSPLAFQALDAEAGKEILVCEKAESFAEQVLWLLAHPDPARNMGQAARAFIRRQFDWEHCTAILEKLITSESPH